LVQLRQRTDQIHELAYFDSVTALPNRVHFKELLSRAIASARRHGRKGAVLYLDLDRFKLINDTFGHDAGDRILVAIAGTLNDIASDQCFVSRHGGEEFVLLFYGFDKHAAWRKLDGVRRVLAQRQLMNRETGKPFGKITFSGGIAEVTEDIDPRSALVRADAALYRAKDVRGTVELYHEEFDTHSVQRLNLAADLSTAVEHDQMSLAYQPLVDAPTRRVVALEALLRWTHPTLGPVPPVEFIPLAERSGTISRLSYFVLDRALVTARELQRQGRTWDAFSLLRPTSPFVQPDKSFLQSNISVIQPNQPVVQPNESWAPGPHACVPTSTWQAYPLHSCCHHSR
ncbi:MAG: GGDEF and EAL domain-containing protein, partial [Akkermansiaceae bacterium]|nr:GGDEF and EAL domain-containing protein [Akkermansiaceae bacterium]